MTQTKREFKKRKREEWKKVQAAVHEFFVGCGYITGEPYLQFALLLGNLKKTDAALKEWWR